MHQTNEISVFIDATKMSEPAEDGEQRPGNVDDVTNIPEDADDYNTRLRSSVDAMTFPETRDEGKQRRNRNDLTKMHEVAGDNTGISSSDDCMEIPDFGHDGNHRPKTIDVTKILEVTDDDILILTNVDATSSVEAKEDDINRIISITDEKNLLKIKPRPSNIEIKTHDCNRRSSNIDVPIMSQVDVDNDNRMISITDEKKASEARRRPSNIEVPRMSDNGSRRASSIDVSNLLEAHPEAVEKWLLEKADPDFVRRLVSLRGYPMTSASSSTASLQQEDAGQAASGIIPRSKRNSVTSELFQLWLASSPIKKAKSPSRPVASGPRRQQLHLLDESELFMELIRDVANELDIDVLCHKILVNVGLLTHADRGSLFLARGPRETRYLVAKLFDVTVDTELEDAIQKARAEEIRIPFGVGIAGVVAQSKEVINIRDAYQDPRFNSEIDLRTGYKTNLILSMPICNYEGEVIGVAQIINKTNGTQEFTKHDVEVFQRYLTFCGIGIQNAQLFEMSVLEFRRNQILLNLARSIFEEQNNLECLVTKIMTEARELLKCERCAVFLLNTDCCEAVSLDLCRLPP